LKLVGGADVEHELLREDEREWGRSRAQEDDSVSSM
jgi:hypothetical protein